MGTQEVRSLSTIRRSSALSLNRPKVTCGRNGRPVASTGNRSIRPWCSPLSSPSEPTLSNSFTLAIKVPSLVSTHSTLDKNIKNGRKDLSMACTWGRTLSRSDGPKKGKQSKLR